MSQYMNDYSGGSIEYPMSFSLGSSGEQYDLIPPAAVGGPAGEMARLSGNGLKDKFLRIMEKGNNE